MDDEYVIWKYDQEKTSKTSRNMLIHRGEIIQILALTVIALLAESQWKL